MKIPKQVLDSVETLDELLDWLTAQDPLAIGELREARQEDLDGRFKPWVRRHLPWATDSNFRLKGLSFSR